MTPRRWRGPSLWAFGLAVGGFAVAAWVVGTPRDRVTAVRAQVDPRRPAARLAALGVMTPPAPPMTRPAAEIPTPPALGPGQGVLVVDSSRDGAGVYLHRQLVGHPGETIVAACGPTWVRLGTEPFDRWIGDGKPITIPCGDSVRVALGDKSP